MWEGGWRAIDIHWWCQTARGAGPKDFDSFHSNFGNGFREGFNVALGNVVSDYSSGFSL